MIGHWSFVVPIIFVLITDPRKVDTQTTLNCNFDEHNLCNWINAQEGQVDWKTSNSLKIDGFHSIPRTLTGSGSFAYVQGRLQRPFGVRDEARLQSPQVSGLSSPAYVSFVYWKTAVFPILDICTQERGQGLRCLDAISGPGPQSWMQRQVTIPANPVPFRIIFRARNLNTNVDIIGLDELVFQLSSSQYVQSQTNSAITSNYQFTPTRKIFRASPEKINGPDGFGLIPIDTTSKTIFDIFDKPPPIFELKQFPIIANRISAPVSEPEANLGFVSGPRDPILGRCEAIRCQFSRDFCNWSNVFDRNFVWKHSSVYGPEFRLAPGNSTPHLLVDGDARHRSQSAGLSSVPLVVPIGAFIQFSTYISDLLVGHLAVYQNRRPGGNSAVLSWERTGADSLGGRGWHQILIPLHTSNHPLTVLFVVDGLSLPQHAVGLDNVQLVNERGQELGCGTNVKNAINQPNIITATKYQQTWTKVPVSWKRFLSEHENSLLHLPDGNDLANRQISRQICDDEDEYNRPIPASEHYYATDRFATDSSERNDGTSIIRPLVPKSISNRDDRTQRYSNRKQWGQSEATSLLPRENHHPIIDKLLPPIQPVGKVGQLASPIKPIVTFETEFPSNPVINKSSFPQLVVQLPSPIKAQVRRISKDEAQAGQLFLGRLAKDFQSLLGISTGSNSAFEERGESLFSQLSKPSNEKSLNEDNLGFIIRNALVGRRK